MAEHGWRLNGTPASYEQIHLSMLAGLLGNVGLKSDDDEWYLGARGIRFYRHPGANLSKKPGRWIVAAELVETTRLYGRGIAAIEPQWLPGIAGHVIKTQLLDPHWEKKAAEVIALERATLYGIPIYSNRRVAFAKIDPQSAREIFIREALVAGEWDTPLPFAAANRKAIAQVQELEHKSRRQDVLVDDELIYDFYAAHVPADVHSGHTFERWYRSEVKRQPRLLMLSRDELMRHEAAGITGAAFPKQVRLGGIDCAATYLHEPGDPKDGVTVTVPIYALNQASEDRCEWLVPGMLKEKVIALLKTPAPAAALATAAIARVRRWVHRGDGICERQPGGYAARRGPREDRPRREARRLQAGAGPCAPSDEHSGRRRERSPARHRPQPGGAESRARRLGALGVSIAGGLEAVGPDGVGAAIHERRTVAAGRSSDRPTSSSGAKSAPDANDAVAAEPARYTAWTFGELPELMEVRKGGQTLVGFPALIDRTTHVEVEVFDEPAVAAAKHRAGLRRLFALQIRDALKYLEKNLPDARQLEVAYMPLGTPADLREQIIDIALDRAFCWSRCRTMPRRSASASRRAAAA